MVSHTPPCRPNSLHPGRTGLQKAGGRVASSAGLETRPGRHIDRQAHRVEVLSPAGRKKKKPTNTLVQLVSCGSSPSQTAQPTGLYVSKYHHPPPARTSRGQPSLRDALSHTERVSVASGARAARLKERGGQGLCVRAQHTKILQKQNISKILILELRTFRQLWMLFSIQPS